MDNEKLTDELIALGKQLATVEANTKGIPDLVVKVDKMCIDVHDNTQFREDFTKIKWISISAFIGSVIAVIIAFFAKKEGG